MHTYVKQMNLKLYEPMMPYIKCQWNNAN